MDWTGFALSLGGVGLTAASGYGMARIRSARAAGNSSAALEVLESLVLPTVTAIAQDATLQLKAAHKDGKLTRREAAAALDTAATEVVEALPAWAEATLLKTAGSPEKMVERLVKPCIEQAAQAIKRTVKVSAKPVSDEEWQRAYKRLGL